MAQAEGRALLLAQQAEAGLGADAQGGRLARGVALIIAIAEEGEVVLGQPAQEGLGLGYVLGATPVASWSWIIQRALGSKRGRVLAVVLRLVKLAFYAGALYLCVTREIVNPVGVLVGMLAVAAVLVIGVLWKGCAPAKEVS
jgi:hypothetical protein